MAKSPMPTAGRHPIRVVAERTGLTPEVLRTWERRYGVVAPVRSDHGQRLYSDADIHRLSLVAKASQRGRGVSQVAGLSLEQLARIVAEDADRGRVRPSPATDHYARALAAVQELAPQQLLATLRRALLSLGTAAFLEQVLAPLLVGIGEEWHAGRITVAHEHAASGAVHHLLDWLMRELEPDGDAPPIVVATPAGERHSFGAMIAGAAAALEGWRVIWLGADLPAAQIAAAARRQHAVVVGLSVAAGEVPVSLQEEIAALRQAIDPETPVLVGGAGAATLGPLEGITVVRDLPHWRSLLRTHAPAHRGAAIS
jgi:MerR family transcriptional regulator, light-induced transcriptional regulator